MHDIEIDFFGTSLGVPLDGSPPLESGHEHHLRAINRVRGLGGIRQAVEAGVLKGGIMHACVQAGVEVVLAGSIRDDGPLPEVIKLGSLREICRDIKITDHNTELVKRALGLLHDLRTRSQLVGRCGLHSIGTSE